MHDAPRAIYTPRVSNVCVTVFVLECPFRCDAGHRYKLVDKDNRTTGCLRLSQVCDGWDECVDEQDEQNCRKWTLIY